MPSNEVLRCQNISKVYGITRRKSALDDLSFKVMEGEIVCVVGPNGAGKSTLLKIVSRIISNFDGTITGSDNFSYVPETSVYFPNMTGFENLKYYADALGKGKDEVLSIMKQLNLENSKILANNFSKGMKRKLDIARAILANSRLVLMDEPFDGLDPMVCDELIRYIEDFSQRGYSFLISSHELSKVQKIGDKILFMENGKIKSQAELKKGSYFYVEFNENTGILNDWDFEGVTVVEKSNGTAIIMISDTRNSWDILEEMLKAGIKVTGFIREPLESQYRRTYNA